MNHTAKLLQEHYEKHPAMELQDAVKFLHQSFMGPGHLISDEDLAAARLEREWNSIEADASVPLFEFLGNGFCRLNLSACKAISLSAKTVFRLFSLTAETAKQNLEGLTQVLDSTDSLPFSAEEVSQFLQVYRAQGCPIVSHSERYRKAYAPAYRVIHLQYASYLPLLAAIDRQLALGSPVRVAIDGPCASGKSTLGAVLEAVYNCPVVHMDDFFLRPEQRTPERLAQPGENVDYTRFKEEVLSPLYAGKRAHYHPWRCSVGSFGPELIVEPAPLLIVEGCYSLRPDLRDYYTLRVWLEAPWETRRIRLLNRGGPACLDTFLSRWIPMEDQYFQAHQVQACCDIALFTE